MAVLDELIPKYYQVIRMGVQREEGDVVAIYDVMILNILGHRIATLNPSSVFTQQEKQAISAIFQRDKAEFEAVTGLTEWVEPDEP